MENRPESCVASELVRMAEDDQLMRSRFIHLQGDWDISIDEQNVGRLKQIVESDGWPTIAKVGSAASRAAWLIAQHSPDTEFMRHCLELMESQPTGAVDPANIAYLRDRVLVLAGFPQIYGTQFFDSDGVLLPFPIAEPESVDQRRAMVGLDSFAANMEHLRIYYQP